MFVNSHKLSKTRPYFPYSPFFKVDLNTRTITIGAELTQF